MALDLHAAIQGTPGLRRVVGDRLLFAKALSRDALCLDAARNDGGGDRLGAALRQLVVVRVGAFT